MTMSAKFCNINLLEIPCVWYLS